MAFVAVMNETIKPYLAARGNSPEDVEKMHLAWCRSIQMQLALWMGRMETRDSHPPNGD